MAITAVSTPGGVCIRGHEGDPLTCYLDAVKVPTIGAGFTMGSAAVRAELIKIGITMLVPGKTKITQVPSDAILIAVLRDEFAPAIVAGSPAERKQHQLGEP